MGIYLFVFSRGTVEFRAKELSNSTSKSQYLKAALIKTLRPQATCDLPIDFQQ